MLTDTDGGYYVKQVVSARGETPLLSWVLWFISAGAAPEPVLVAGNRMLIVTAALSTLMIAEGVWLLGFPMHAPVVALGTTMSVLYFARTSIGRIDTDQLTVGFWVLLLGLAYQSLLDPRMLIGFGVVAWLFDRWYPKPVFSLLSIFVMGAIGTSHFGLAGAALAFPLIVAFAWFYEDAAWTELKCMLRTYAARGPSSIVQGTVSELTRPTLRDAAVFAMNTPIFVPFALGGLLVFALERPLQAACLAPAVAFVPVALLRGNRFLIYAIPSLWFGFAYLIGDGVVPALLLTTIAAVSNPQRHSLPAPKFGPGITALLAKAVPQEATRVASWWDYGYWIELWSGRPPVCDPGAPWSNETREVARALTSVDEQAARARLMDLGSVSHLLVTKEMAGWWHAMAKVAGRPPDADPNRSVYAKLMFGQSDPALFKPVAEVQGVARLYEVVQ